MKRRTRIAPPELPFARVGGARRGAGRKPRGERAGVSHAARPKLSRHHPVHVTARLRAGLPNLRDTATRQQLERAFGAGADRFGFRLVHYSIQSNHLHLIAEAGDARALSRGMQGLLIRVARALNRLWRHRGPVFADRYHAHVLRTPREVRNALAYVLQNAQKHGCGSRGVDPFSSGRWFDGWSDAARAAPARGALAPSALPPARTWLLTVGWRRWGRIGVHDLSALVRSP